MEITKEYIDAFRDAVTERDNTVVKQLTDDLHFADISEILYNFNTEDSKYVIELLGEEVSAQIISDLDEDVRERFLRNFTSDEIVKFIEHIDSDDAADILNEQPLKVREEVIGLLSNKEKSTNISELLRYDENVAGGLMAKEFVKAKIDWTAKQCIEEIRRQAENVEKVHSVYVVDGFNVLLGRVSMKKLILANDDDIVKDLIEDDIKSIESYKSEEEVVEMMSKYDLVAIPVVNMKGVLLGRITIDDVVDVMYEQAELERQIMAGMSDSVEHRDSVLAITRARLPWLIIGVLGGLLGAKFIGIFENELAKVTAMAFFIPLITATGGNVGIQSSTIIVQSLANKSFNHANVWQVLSKSMIVAVLNGIVICTIVFVLNLFISEGMALAAVVAIALFFVVMLSALMGTITPLVLDKLNINPALASGPFITTSNDLLGIGVYFLVAKLLLDII